MRNALLTRPVVFLFGWICLAFSVGHLTAEGAEVAIKLRGRDGQAVNLTAEDLQRLPRAEVEAKDRDDTMVKFSGVLIRELLKKVDVPQGKELRGPWMRCVVAVDAADGYRAVYALAEFEATFKERKIILADRRNGAPLAEPHGPLMVVVPDEKRHSRWARMVTAIRVIDLDPDADKQARVSTPQIPAIEPSIARQFVDQRVVVMFKVQATKNAKHKNVVYLDSEENFNSDENLGIELSEQLLATLKQKRNIDDAAEYFYGKKIRVTGKVVLREERPYIDVSDLDQLELLSE